MTEFEKKPGEQLAEDTAILAASSQTSFAGRLRNYFLTGLVVAGPLLITAYLTWSFVTWVDNLVRPMLVGKETRMPDYVVLISTIGGMSLFGISGFVIGPVIAALFIAAWDLSAAEAEKNGE